MLSLSMVNPILFVDEPWVAVGAGCLCFAAGAFVVVWLAKTRDLTRSDG